MTVVATYQLLSLTSGTARPQIEGRLPALYVMIVASGTSAKVGALEAATNAPVRLSRVQAAHRRREPNAGYPMRLAVVLELCDLPIAGDHDIESEERWAEVEHLESALRLVLARRLGRLARWTDWIHVQRPLTDAEWVGEIEKAWIEVRRVGNR